MAYLNDLCKNRGPKTIVVATTRKSMEFLIAALKPEVVLNQATKWTIKRVSHCSAQRERFVIVTDLREFNYRRTQSRHRQNWQFTSCPYRSTETILTFTNLILI